MALVRYSLRGNLQQKRGGKYVITELQCRTQVSWMIVCEWIEWSCVGEQRDLNAMLPSFSSIHNLSLSASCLFWFWRKEDFLLQYLRRVLKTNWTFKSLNAGWWYFREIYWFSNFVYFKTFECTPYNILMNFAQNIHLIM